MVNDTLVLPPIESFDDDEKLLAQVVIGYVRRGGALYYGKYIEAMVAGLLVGAQFPTGGISPWDLVLPNGTRVGVRSGADAFSLKGRNDVDLWVFYHKNSHDDARFLVASAQDVSALGKRSISATRLRKRFTPLTASALVNAVEQIVGREPRERVSHQA